MYMTNAIQPSWQFPEMMLPNDLRQWIEEHTLARLVLAAVQDRSVPSAHDPAVADRNGGFLPHILLSLLTYCYATGIYSSTDIELSFTQDSLVRHLCANTYPEAHRSRWFRRDNRQRIQRSLAEVFQRAWCIRYGLEEPTPEAVAACCDHCLDPGVGRQDALFFAVEAEERINRAVRLDCGAFDC